MKKFLDENFLLESDTAVELYHTYAANLPIIDYHCHLPPAEIASDMSFRNLTHAWLQGDHYKWRAMRANGVNEQFITGDACDEDKFEKWASTVPYTLRNPLYHWTHLELQRYFGIDDLLSESTSGYIYKACNERLGMANYSVRSLLAKMNVEMVGTTDDPLDNLEDHKKIATDGFAIKVLPSFRPDKAMNCDDTVALNKYIDQLEKATNTSVGDIQTYLDALKSRHDYFAANGCKVSDHGLEHIYADDYTETEIAAIFLKIRAGKDLTVIESGKFKSFMLFQFALWDHEKGWVQQYHLGALRNNNKRLLSRLGPDTGWDSIGDFQQASSLSRFLNRLDSEDKLAKTIVYNLNPADNAVFAAMIGNFNDGSVAGKVQYGSGWWFLDQKDGMTQQINALSNMGLISRFIGMLTDSRSFLSFPRHEYFRRLLCNLFATDIEKGELPNDIVWTGKIIGDICYHNAKSYFQF